MKEVQKAGCFPDRVFGKSKRAWYALMALEHIKDRRLRRGVQRLARTCFRAASASASFRSASASASASFRAASAGGIALALWCSHCGAVNEAVASPAADQDAESRIEGAGTVIIGGKSCQLIALDDGRFIALQSGALPKTDLPVKARIKIVAEPVSAPSCAHAQSVDVKAFHRLPDLLER